jgi:hypothetical protein
MAPADKKRTRSILKPDIRLCVTLISGIIAVFLFKAESGFAPDLFSGINAGSAILWLTVIFVSSMLMYRIEGRKIPVGIYILMIISCSMCTLLRYYSGYTWFLSVCIFIVIGSSVLRSVNFSKDGTFLNLKSMIQGPVIFFCSPMLLYASGKRFRKTCLIPRKGAEILLGIFPIILVSGFMLQFTLTILKCRGPIISYALYALSFSVWTWVGCGLIHVLSPWPEKFLVTKTEKNKTTQKIGSLALIIFFVTILILPAKFNRVSLLTLFHPYFILGGISCLLLTQLIRRPESSFVSCLKDLPENKKATPFGIALFLLIAISPVVLLGWAPFKYIISGNLFTSTFSRYRISGALDQSGISKYFFLFMYTGFQSSAFAAIARWAANRKTRLGYWTFIIPVFIMCIFLLSILTMPFYWLIQYIQAMGYTKMRITGLIYGAGGYLTVIAFFIWCAWPPDKKPLL